jgi:hypothetical protein
MLSQISPIFLILHSSTAEETEKVLNHHLQAIGAGDLDGILEDYTGDSTIITPEGALHGLDEIRGLFVQLLELFPVGSTLDMKQQVIEGEVAYIFWSGESVKVDIPIGTDTFIVLGGKIVTQTFAAQINPKA